jgi:hypothetical protein
MSLKHQTLSIVRLVLAAMLPTLAVLGCSSATNNTQLPPDAKTSCTVSTAVFPTWFQSGAVSKDGVVKPDSAQFTNPLQNCPFYQWSEQMFLWATSPTPDTYGGGGGRIFDSPVFFDVSPPQSDGSRTLIPHAVAATGLPMASLFRLRAAQAGPHNLPVISAVSGQLLEVALPKKGQRPLVRSATGQPVEIAHARLGQNRMPVLLDRAGNVIAAQHAEANRNIAGPRVVTQLVIDRIRIFLDQSSLAVVDVEQNEADNGVLEAQTGSLVYYETTFNDVFAYFATGVIGGQLSATQFPTSPGDMAPIEAFALTASTPATFPDPDALAVELKTSWVEASTIPASNLGTYITKTATIPTYDVTTFPSKSWIQNGKKTVQLALVGMQVVGTVPGHPEMIWATFEHFANAPRAEYKYINSGGAVTTIPLDSTDPPIGQGGAIAQWLFAASGSSGPFNQKLMSYNATPIPPEIDAGSTTSIGPSDTVRWKAFGAASDTVPNPLVASVAESNTEIISINNSVRGQLLNGDVRWNYILTGATWTENGALPRGIFNGSNAPGVQVGTSVLSSITMETYQQGRDTTLANGGTNCFSCHTGFYTGFTMPNLTSVNNNTTLFGVSHIFPALRPLF